MSILIKGMEMPKIPVLFCIHPDGKVFADLEGGWREYKAVHVPPHGDLIDKDVFRKKMYNDAFETDSNLQKWDSGCWIRYKMFERNIESAHVIIPAERSNDEPNN